MIGFDHFIPVYGSWKAFRDTKEAYERGEISALAGGTYLGSKAAVETIHAVHAAHKTGKVSYFTTTAVSRMMAAPMVGVAAIPVTLAGANMVLIESAPEEEQQGMWHTFVSGLTGTFGIGSGLNLY